MLIWKNWEENFQLIVDGYRVQNEVLEIAELEISRPVMIRKKGRRKCF